ncbi:MAG: restriction endonuclease [Pedosphaera sp. Tous-C6FEB]|nr:MAG: restriction endonuclease [Pedosphaera sp. Tous-C6FEB]
MSQLPTYDRLMNPVLQALRGLGGSGSTDEIYQRVAEDLKLPESVLSVLHDPETSNQTEVQYRMAWARTYLKKFGFLETPQRGLWSLTKKAESISEVDTKEVQRYVRELDRKQRLAKAAPEDTAEQAESERPEEAKSWRSALHTILTKKLSPAAFERLIQRVLRESGFIQVEVVGRTGDGGIDGKGIARIHGFMSFHVVFQCKRWQGVVGAGEIRDFRGAMVGRADKGLFITTGTFSRDAIKEATRDGAPPIDLVDGDTLADKLKELKLGIATAMIESITVDAAWFERI